jgi:hypothetical protein
MKKTLQIKRIQKIECPENRSAFLWGPRKTGKTTLLKQQFPHACWVDLLDYDIFFALSQKPTNLRQIIQAQESNLVVIDQTGRAPLPARRWGQEPYHPEPHVSPSEKTLRDPPGSRAPCRRVIQVIFSLCHDIK